MKKSKSRLTHPIRFMIERQFVKGAQYQLLAVVALIGLISVTGGFLAYSVESPEWEFGESVWWAFLRLTDPGYLGDDTGTVLRIVSTFLTVSGYVVFLGALVAIMTQWLNSKMDELEKGLTPVAVKNHIVILGWTDRTHPIVVEFFQSVGKLQRFLARFGEKKLRLVILAENLTAQLASELKADRLIGKRSDEIILRSGTPLQRDHLLRVDCYNASAIIIPSHKTVSRDLVSADVETIKTLLSLSNNPEIKEPAQLPYVVAEIQNEKKLSVARRAYPGPLEIISGDSIISRLIAQNVRHVGLSDIYESLLSRGVETDMYTREHTSMSGKTLQEVKGYFPKAVIMGVVRREPAGFKPILNAEPDLKILKGDRLVFLAGTHDDTEPATRGGQHPGSAVSASERKEQHLTENPGMVEKELLILGWNSRLPALINEFGSYHDRSYSITMVSVASVEERKALIDEEVNASRVHCSYIQADYMNEADLRRVAPARFDHIILLSSDLVADTDEADARTIVGKVLLDEIIQNPDERPQILIELANPDNRSLVTGKYSEMIISPIIISHMLAQVALRRELHSIYTELFTVGGAEIEFRNPERYHMKPGTYTFADIETIANRYGETALGICKHKKNVDLKNKVILNPARQNQFSLNEHDELVVLMRY